MSTLSNVNTRRGGENPSCAGPTSCALPEAQGAPGVAKCSEGESSTCVSKERPQWFVLRATYGRLKQAVDLLQDNDIEIYVPMHDVTKIINGKRRTFHEPLLPDIVFARMTRSKTREFVKDPAPSAKWLKYYTDKTKPLERTTGFNPPIVIPDNEMLNFIKASSVSSEHSGMISKERVRYKSGDLVQITKGDFKGVIGRVVRAAGQQRIALELEGIGIFITAYIPNDFLKVLKRCETVV